MATEDDITTLETANADLRQQVRDAEESRLASAAGITESRRLAKLQRENDRLKRKLAAEQAQAARAAAKGTAPAPVAPVAPPAPTAPTTPAPSTSAAPTTSTGASDAPATQGA